MMTPPPTQDPTRKKYLDYRASCQQAFPAYAPIDLPDFFVGRTKDIERLVDELNAPGRQVAIIGERGVGKTSLVMLAPFFAERDENVVHHIKCAKSTTFDSIFAEVLDEAGVAVVLNGVETTDTRRARADAGPFHGSLGKDTKRKFRTLSIPHRITSRLLLKYFHDRNGLIILDEYDRVEDADTHTRLAETLKHFSDARSTTKIIVVGVADTLSQLIGEHESLSRCVAPLALDRMSEDDLRELIRHGEDRVGVTFQETIKQRTVRLADGFPHYAHLVALYSAWAAGEILLKSPDARPVVANQEYETGIRLAVDNAEPQLIEDFERATVTVRRKSEKFELVLYAISLSSEKVVQVGQIASYAEWLTTVKYSNAAFSYHLGELVKPERSSILIKVREGYYQFKNPLMRAFIRLQLELENILYHGGQFEFPFMRKDQ